MDIMCPIVDAETDVPFAVTSLQLPLSDLCCGMDNNCGTDTTDTAGTTDTSEPDYFGFVLDGFCTAYGS